MEDYKDHRHEWLGCRCGCVECHIRVTTYDDEEDVFLEYHLSRTGFWRRVWNGIRYIFAGESDYHDIILNPDEQRKLKRMLRG